MINEELDEPYDLTEDQIEFYRINGFIKLKNVFTADLLEHFTASLQSAVDAATTAPPLDAQLAKDNEDPTYARAFKQVINIWRENSTVKKLAFSKRIGRIAAELMQVILHK